jgi:uncharacterized protein YigA (DUF484 family)
MSELSLSFPHAAGLTSAKVVSFVDKQLQLTQKRQAELESSLSEMMEAIENNARLQLNLHDLTLEVMQSSTLPQAIELIKKGLIQRFELRDVQLWGQANSGLAKAVPTEGMQLFLTYLQSNPLVFGSVSAFPCEIWAATGVVSGCAFRMSAFGHSYGVLVLGRSDNLFNEAADTLFLQQFVDIMSLWLARLGALHPDGNMTMNERITLE